MGSGKGKSRRASAVQSAPRSTKVQNTPSTPSDTPKIKKKAKPLPTFTLDSVWHIGTLNPKDLHKNFPWSHEGHGLSVSTDPDEWERIAKLGGYPRHELRKKGGNFIDFHNITASQRKAVSEWGITNGYVETKTLWRVHFEDTEEEETKYFTFEDEESAREEADSLGSDPDNDIKQTIGLKPTNKFHDKTGTRPTADCFDELLVFYADEELPNVDGVWWEDEYGDLSAPRGCIFPSRLNSWKQ